MSEQARGAQWAGVALLHSPRSSFGWRCLLVLPAHAGITGVDTETRQARAVQNMPREVDEAVIMLLLVLLAGEEKMERSRSRADAGLAGQNPDAW